MVAAPIERTCAALMDPDVVVVWLAPGGMTGRIEHFDPRPGGSYRMVLTYTAPAAARGKALADSDIVEARFVDVVRNVRIVLAVDFVSDGPQYAGTMTMIRDVARAEADTRVEFRAEGVPDGISAKDHAAGLTSSLANLVSYVEH